MKSIRICFTLYNYSEEDYLKIKSIDYDHIIISKDIIDFTPVISGYMKLKKQVLDDYISEINPKLIYEILDDGCSIESYKKNGHEEHIKKIKTSNMIDLRIFDYYK
ncbi:hypothetical protein [Fowlpox virus]|nr:hypothetical protein [Fowlpox virus]